MPKVKCKIIDEMQAKNLGLRKGRDGSEAECLVCKPGTYISVAHRGSGDLNKHVLSEKHIRAVRAATASKRILIALTQQDTYRKMASLLQKALTPFTLLNTITVLSTMPVYNHHQTIPNLFLRKQLFCH